jgi:hypothetical protein
VTALLISSCKQSVAIDLACCLPCVYARADCQWYPKYMQTCGSSVGAVESISVKRVLILWYDGRCHGSLSSSSRSVWSRGVFRYTFTFHECQANFSDPWHCPQPLVPISVSKQGVGCTYRGFGRSLRQLKSFFVGAL